jgi:hypothetical protein
LVARVELLAHWVILLALVVLVVEVMATVLLVVLVAAAEEQTVVKAVALVVLVTLVAITHPKELLVEQIPVVLEWAVAALERLVPQLVVLVQPTLSLEHL